MVPSRCGFPILKNHEESIFAINQVLIYLAPEVDSNWSNDPLSLLLTKKHLDSSFLHRKTSNNVLSRKVKFAWLMGHLCMETYGK